MDPYLLPASSPCFNTILHTEEDGNAAVYIPTGTTVFLPTSSHLNVGHNLGAEVGHRQTRYILYILTPVTLGWPCRTGTVS